MKRKPFYIMEDSRGFTTACAPTRDAMFEEAGRVPLHAPIRVTSWTPVGDGLKVADWKKLDEWMWNGGL